MHIVNGQPCTSLACCCRDATTHRATVLTGGGVRRLMPTIGEDEMLDEIALAGMPVTFDATTHTARIAHRAWRHGSEPDPGGMVVGWWPDGHRSVVARLWLWMRDVQVSTELGH
jgi:hypothetical protein